MNSIATEQRQNRACPQCGTLLAAGVPADFCPKCLLRAGVPTVEGGTEVLPPPVFATDELERGQEFGHYRIVRRIGSGGMGTVFEAEDLANSRRVALKVLSKALDSPEARQRFFREGRMAAAINHPNSVYVFGTEEIAGTPVITMELVAGGTLQDRVAGTGPLKPADAVDIILQVIAGLEAAQQAGVLHRDVKPSNCFLDPEGTVKIGDFGLSIATALRTEPAITATGAFVGTPAFCSPEQLRGEELSVRSDIYSVGATLYYLMTGRTPFSAANIVALVAAILEQPAPNPRRVRAEIPTALARLVCRCLDRHPSERPATYQELRRALEPYGSVAPAPATLGLRFIAGTVDLGAFSFLMFFLVLATGDPFSLLDDILRRSPGALLVLATGLIGSVLYYSLCEWRWGATPGKLLCGLRVVRQDRNQLEFLRVLGRTALYVLLPVLPAWTVIGWNPASYFESGMATQHALSVSFYVVLGLLFATARRRNGFAAVHDLLTRTRVIARLPLSRRAVVAGEEAAPSDLATANRRGPYHILRVIEKLPDGEWLLGYDLQLLRKVWIRTLPAGTAPIGGSERRIGRPTRLRWLAGRRSPEENWDAFEAPGGRPLLQLLQHWNNWADVRFWLWDLAAELETADRDGTLPQVLALDRVWITADGRAKLLGFPVPGASDYTPALVRAVQDAPADPSLSPDGAKTHFLNRVAAAALAGDAAAAQVPADQCRVPLALHAREFLKSLHAGTSLGATIGALKLLLNKPATITRWRRFAVLCGCLIVPFFTAPGVIFASRMLEQMQRKNPGLIELNQVLQQRWAMRHFGRQASSASEEDFGVYIATHCGPVVTNAAIWKSALAMALVQGEKRAFAERSVARYSSPTAEQVARAENTVGPFARMNPQPPAFSSPFWALFISMVSMFVYVGLPALVCAFLFRGGLVVRLTSVLFVRRDGKRASRWRVFWRAVIAWAPLAVGIAVVAPRGSAGIGYEALLVTGLLAVLAALSVLLPTRGLPDRLSGTWLVPR